MGGDCIGSDLVQLSTGFDFVKMVIQAAAGEEVELIRKEHEQAAAVRYIFDDHDIERYHQLRKECPESIFRFSEMIRKEKIAATDSSRRWGFYIVTGENAQEVCQLAELPLSDERS